MSTRFDDLIANLPPHLLVQFAGECSGLACWAAGLTGDVYDAAVDTTSRFARGDATAEDMRRTWTAVGVAARDVAEVADLAAPAAGDAAWAAGDAAWDTARAAAWVAAGDSQEEAAQEAAREAAQEAAREAGYSSTVEARLAQLASL